MRSDFKDKKKVLVAGKAGKNDDPHHGHLDIGHFVVYWQGEYFIQDIRRKGSYDEKHFDNARFNYPQASSVGHNVVFVNGEEQLSGKLRKQPFNYEIGGDVTEFRTSSERDYVIMNPTNAYPKKELKGWRRHVLLDKPVITVVVDEVKANPGSEIEVRFHPGVDFNVKEDFVLLEGGEGKMALIPIVATKFKIRLGKHASQFVNATKDFFWIDYFGTVVKAEDEKNTIVTIILPVSGSEEAQMIADSKEITFNNSGNLSLSFSKEGEKYKYEYQNSEKGLTLKK